MLFVRFDVKLTLPLLIKGYDDIPKEIPDPDAKKVHLLVLLGSFNFGSCTLTTCQCINSIRIFTARGLG